MEYAESHSEFLLSQPHSPPADVQPSSNSAPIGFKISLCQLPDSGFGYFQNQPSQTSDNFLPYDAISFGFHTSDQGSVQGPWPEPAAFLSDDQSFQRSRAFSVSDTLPNMINADREIGERIRRDNTPQTMGRSKSLGNHNRRHFCNHRSCNYRSFVDKAGLTRHLRELHGTEVHHCPFISCKRHKLGFPRKYNLIQHQKRCHSGSPTLELIENSKQFAEITPSPNIDDDSRSETHSTRDDSYSKGEDVIREKLQTLRALRNEKIQELDRDIASLEHAMSLMGEI